MLAVLFLVSVFAAGVAAIAGFGIGSLITPVLSLTLGAKLAIAAVSIPHFVATALRFWMLRGHVDRKILFSFGITSAVGGLLGALLHTELAVPELTLLFGGILIFAGFMALSGFAEKMRLRGIMAWLGGFFSGMFGGLVGNQGGIRSAALLGFDIRKEAFVATATAIGLIVDAVRMPVYFYHEGTALREHLALVAVLVVAVVLGTLAGGKLLRRLPEKVFRRILSGLILALGLFMIYRGLG
jgi:uncharacterized membrane protein YfcA